MSKVDFPEPEGPKQADRLAPRYAQADVLEHMDPRGAFAQREVDVHEFDDLLARRDHP